MKILNNIRVISVPSSALCAARIAESCVIRVPICAQGVRVIRWRDESVENAQPVRSV